MQTSSTRLTKPLHIWISRTLGIGIVLACIWANIASLPGNLQTIKHTGLMNDVHLRYDANGSAFVAFASAEAKQMGVAVGDKLLNSEDPYTFGEVGSPVTLFLQTANNPLRAVTLSRIPWWTDAMAATFLGMSLPASINFAILILIIPLIFVGVASLLLCWLKSDDWMALLTAAAIASVNGIPGKGSFFFVFSALTNLLLFLWIVIFPNGKLLPRWGAYLVLISVFLRLLLQSLFYWNVEFLQHADIYFLLQDRLIPVLQTFSSLMSLVVIAYRYKYVFSPVERQQSKWAVIPMLILICPLVILNLLGVYYREADQFDKYIISISLFNVLFALLTIAAITGVLFSVFQYRLYDVDVFASRAIVYSGLTGILALVGILAIRTVDYILKQSLGDQTGLLPVLISALPVAALFNPVREHLQNAVDRRFKEEQIDFENSFIEFTAELRSLFTIKELSTLLSRHAVEQLDVAYASVFMNGQNGNLKHIKTTALEQETPKPILDEKTVERIKNGLLASPEGNYARSLIIPLVVPRSRKPTVLGALVLGPRLKGLGYSTSMVHSLKKFGEEVGKAFYLAEVKGKQKG